MCKNREINVAFSVNEKYVPYMGVALFSLLKNSSKEYYYNIYVLFSSLSDNSKDKIAGMETSNSLIEFLDVSGIKTGRNYYDGVLDITSHITEETFYRLLLPELLPDCDRILYLDCDIVVMSDIAELYGTDLDGCSAGAVYSVEHWNKEGTGSYLPANGQEAFNAAVMLLDLDKYRKCGYPQKCNELLAENRFDMADQELLRIVCYGDTKYLPYEWNVMWHHLYTELNRLKSHNRDIYYEMIKRPKILHYSGYLKPWERADLRLSRFFWKYARQTEFYEEILMLNSGGITVKEEPIWSEYLFPFDLIKQDSDIVLYGAGRVGKTFKKQIESTGWCRMAAWADKNAASEENKKLGLCTPERIRDFKDAKVVLAVENVLVAEEIKEELGKYVDDEMIVWRDPRKVKNNE